MENLTPSIVNNEILKADTKITLTSARPLSPQVGKEVLTLRSNGAQIDPTISVEGDSTIQGLLPQALHSQAH